MSKQVRQETDHRLGGIVAKSVKTGKKSSGGKSVRIESDGKFGKKGK